MGVAWREYPKNRKLHCSKCGVIVDRDVNAARNILARGVTFAPIALPVEAIVQEPNAGLIWPNVILKVDGTELTC